MMTRIIVKSRLNHITRKTIAISRYNNKQCGLNVPHTTVGAVISAVGWLPSSSVYGQDFTVLLLATEQSFALFHNSNFRNSLMLSFPIIACQCAVCTTVRTVLV
jgi:hypothetical protein